ncbi:hypothetical protein ACFRAA_10050 [[Kitasatospora] papulosa]|uniref:hypothetical protein n=1 Tax=[Kitasatospora] papulosa TaxID=1464011 RepID=UPI00363B0255
MAGIERVDGPGTPSTGLSGLGDDEARAVRSLLLANPAFITPLENPSQEELLSLGVDPSGFKSENPRAVALSVCAQLPNGTPLYGCSRLVALENGLRMGSTLLLHSAERWTETLESLEAELVVLLQAAAEGVQPRPEPNGKEWRKVAALLGGSDSRSSLPRDWKRRMRLAAGLREVELDIRPNPESARSEIVKDLRSKPPNALLVWVDWVKNPEVFIAPFIAARPGAKAEHLGTRDQAMDFSEHLAELSMHLSEISPIGESVVSNSEAVKDWSQAAGEVLELCGEHFVLTERAVKMLDGNPYPKPARMLDHLERLARVAKAYSQGRGDLGGRLADYASSEEGIEIALTDNGLGNPRIKLNGEWFSTQPHVKVDDAKSPADCGRVYFALDNVGYRFVVDHVGLHDYR